MGMFVDWDAIRQNIAHDAGEARKSGLLTTDQYTELLDVPEVEERHVVVAQALMQAAHQRAAEAREPKVVDKRKQAAYDRIHPILKPPPGPVPEPVQFEPRSVVTARWLVYQLQQMLGLKLMLSATRKPEQLRSWAKLDGLTGRTIEDAGFFDYSDVERFRSWASRLGN